MWSKLISTASFILNKYNLHVFKKIYRRRQWHPTPVLLPGKSHGWRRLEGCSPWGRWGSDMTERLHCHFSLTCIGEGNGNPLQCSCLENPRDGGAWWAAVYGVTQSRTQLKWLSSSSSSSSKKIYMLSYLCFSHYPTSLKRLLPSNSLMYKPKSHHLFLYVLQLPTSQQLLFGSHRQTWSLNY